MKKNVVLRTNFFICLIIILGFAITSFISYHSNSGIFRQDIEHISSLTSEGICHQIDSIFTKPINISLTMANDSLLKGFLREESDHTEDEAFIRTMRDYLLAYKEKYEYDSVFLVSAKTNRYYHYDQGIDRVLTAGDPENDWYYAFLQSQNEYSINIDNDEVNAANNEITIFINCKIREAGGDILGVVGVGFRVNYLQALFREYEQEMNVKAYLIDPDGMIEVSTTQTGYEKTDLFSDSVFAGLKDTILAPGDKARSLWYSENDRRGYLVSQHIPNLQWYLVIDNDTSALEQKLNQQFYMGVMVILLVMSAVIFVVMNIFRRYNKRIVELTMEKEKEHRTLFQTATEHLYENIYELDITHNRAASEATEAYFESLGMAKNTPFDEALSIIAKKQIKEEYRQGYLDTFTPSNVLKAYEDGKDSLSYDFMNSNNGGATYYWMRITTRIFYWEDDQSVRMFSYHQNIDKEKQQEKQMIEKMKKDSLTGLYNKAATQEQIRRLLAENPGKSFAFFILDIDDFKHVNDTCGHATGDLVIADFARILKNQFQEEDVIGRIGGDEFVAFTPAASREWTWQMAQNLVLILHHEFTDGAKRCTITTSIGAAISPEDGMDFETLYKNADTALYQIKRKSKNAFKFYKKNT